MATKKPTSKYKIDGFFSGFSLYANANANDSKILRANFEETHFPECL